MAYTESVPVVSTLHIPPSCAADIESGKFHCAFALRDFGYLVSVGGNYDYSPELRTLVSHFAGFDWVRLSNVGDVYSTIPGYEWP